MVISMKWISVDEKLPQTTGQFDLVLVATDKGVGFATYDGLREFSRVTVTGNKQYSSLKVTHWMPLPDSPDE